MISSPLFSKQSNTRLAYSIKAMLPEHLKLNNIPLEFSSVPEKNDKVIYFKDGFDSMDELKTHSENKLKEYGSLSPLLITCYSIGDKTK